MNQPLPQTFSGSQ